MNGNVSNSEILAEVKRVEGRVESIEQQLLRLADRHVEVREQMIEARPFGSRIDDTETRLSAIELVLAKADLPARLDAHADKLAEQDQFMWKAMFVMTVASLVGSTLGSVAISMAADYLSGVVGS